MNCLERRSKRSVIPHNGTFKEKSQKANEKGGISLPAGLTQCPSRSPSGFFMPDLRGDLDLHDKDRYIIILIFIFIFIMCISPFSLIPEVS